MNFLDREFNSGFILPETSCAEVQELCMIIETKMRTRGFFIFRVFVFLYKAIPKLKISDDLASEVVFH